MPEKVVVDGSYGEGGGQIIRTSLALSCITGRPVTIERIRAGREKPGLKAQHLTGVLAAAQLCDAVVSDAAVGSSQLNFEPKRAAQAGNYRFDIGTAGATTLVIQTVVMPLLLAQGDSTVTITGGTHVSHAPTIDYTRCVLAPALKQMGACVDAQYSRAGFYPKGGGEAVLHVQGACRLKPIDLRNRGDLTDLRAHIVTGNLPDHVAQRGTQAAHKCMKAIGRPLSVEVAEAPCIGNGAAITLVARCEGGYAGFSQLGERGKPMERVAQDACQPFMGWWRSNATVDEHLADQLVLPAALAGGTSRWITPQVSEHLRTVLWLTSQFLPIEYSLEPTDTGASLVTINAR